jgi:hypothetical protein
MALLDKNNFNAVIRPTALQDSINNPSTYETKTKTGVLLTMVIQLSTNLKKTFVNENILYLPNVSSDL